MGWFPQSYLCLHLDCFDMRNKGKDPIYLLPCDDQYNQKGGILWCKQRQKENMPICSHHPSKRYASSFFASISNMEQNFSYTEQRNKSLPRLVSIGSWNLGKGKAWTLVFDHWPTLPMRRIDLLQYLRHQQWELFISSQVFKLSIRKLMKGYWHNLNCCMAQSELFISPLF